MTYKWDAKYLVVSRKSTLEIASHSNAGFILCAVAKCALTFIYLLVCVWMCVGDKRYYSIGCFVCETFRWASKKSVSVVAIDTALE